MLICDVYSLPGSTGALNLATWLWTGNIWSDIYDDMSVPQNCIFCYK